MPFDFADLFTASARRVTPLLVDKKLASSFDCRGPAALLSGDANDVRRSLHRLMCALVDLVDIGFAVMHAQTQMTRNGRCQVSVKLAGTGLLADPEAAERVITRLELIADDSQPGQQPLRLRRASGRCPCTGATVRYASLPAEGVILTIDWLFAVDSVLDADTRIDADQARAWVIHDDDVACQSLVQRLQRLGWATAHFDGVTSALRRLRGLPAGQARPALVVAVECDAVSPHSVQTLRPFLPTWTTAIYAALAGSPTLGHADPVPGFDVLVHPFSPGDLTGFTQALSPQVDAGSGWTRPAPLTLADRPLALVADANDCARVAASALLESLGYLTATASDGASALAQCRLLQPAVVLLDAQLPGIDAATVAHLLRALERSGASVPCVVLGMGADMDEPAERVARSAGMDATVAKPLHVGVLRSELRRLCADVAAPAL